MNESNLIFAISFPSAESHNIYIKIRRIFLIGLSKIKSLKYEKLIPKLYKLIVE